MWSAFSRNIDLLPRLLSPVLPTKHAPHAPSWYYKVSLRVCVTCFVCVSVVIIHIPTGLETNTCPHALDSKIHSLATSKGTKQLPKTGQACFNLFRKHFCTTYFYGFCLLVEVLSFQLCSFTHIALLAPCTIQQ